MVGSGGGEPPPGPARGWGVRRFVRWVLVAAVAGAGCGDMTSVDSEQRVRTACEKMFRSFPDELDGRGMEQAVDDCVRADREGLSDPTP